MAFSEILRTRRTVRMYQQKEVPWKDLEECVDAARYAPSARNIQPMEYVLVTDPRLRKELFSCIGLGGGVTDLKGKEPMAYAVVLINKSLRGDFALHDCGLAVQNLILAAWEKGIASCILARVNKDRIRGLIKIPDSHEIELVVTMGYPAEKPVAFDSDDMKQFSRDERGTLHVPKRTLKSVLHRDGF